MTFKRESGTNAREKLYLGYISKRSLILGLSVISIILYYFILDFA